MLRQYQVDGVIVASSTLPLAFSKTFKDANIPVVHSFGKFSSVPDVHVIGIDNTQSGRMAAEHFKKLGCKSVGFMGGPKHATSTKDRWRGFQEQLLQYPEISVSCSFATAYSFDAGRQRMQLNLAEHKKANLPDAYFCGDDVLSIGALSAINDAGFIVPDDIGILGLNDMEMAAWESINLTTIHQPIEQIIHSSVELIVALIEEPDRLPEARLFSTRIIERGTLPKLVGRNKNV
jgi:DNA-binding LacI/PurR family transcriptional regulator